MSTDDSFICAPFLPNHEPSNKVEIVKRSKECNEENTAKPSTRTSGNHPQIPSETNQETSPAQKGRVKCRRVERCTLRDRWMNNPSRLLTLAPAAAQGLGAFLPYRPSSSETGLPWSLRY